MFGFRTAQGRSSNDTCDGRDVLSLNRVHPWLPPPRIESTLRTTQIPPAMASNTALVAWDLFST
jgi:hypothetical protein